MKLNKRLTVTALVLGLTLMAVSVLPLSAQIDCPCVGRVETLYLMYTGSAAANVTVVVNRGGGFEVYNASVDPGEVFSFNGSGDGLQPEIDISVDGAPHTSIHTSCSVDLNPGDVYGDFVVVAMEDQSGTGLCPSTCDSGSLSGGIIQYDQPNKTVSWDITNNSPTDPRLMHRLFDTVWPTENGNLLEVTFGGVSIWTGSQGEPAEIYSGWSGTVADRTLAGGQTKALELRFLTDVNTSPTDTDPYVIWVEFYGTDCMVSVSEGGATVITLSSLAAKSTSGGSVSPLWLGVVAGLTVLAAGGLFWAKRRASQ